MPFLMLPITLFFTPPVAAGLAAAPRRGTGALLPSLVSLVMLLLPALVAGLEGGALLVVAIVPVRRVRVGAAAADELVLPLETAVTFRFPPVLVALAFSTMFVKTLFAAAARGPPIDFSGEPGRANCDLVGEAGRSRLGRRELEDAGDRT